MKIDSLMMKKHA